MKAHIIFCNNEPKAVVLDDLAKAYTKQRELQGEDKRRVISKHGPESYDACNYDEVYCWHVSTVSAE